MIPEMLLFTDELKRQQSLPRVFAKHQFQRSHIIFNAFLTFRCSNFSEILSFFFIHFLNLTKKRTFVLDKACKYSFVLLNILQYMEILRQFHFCLYQSTFVWD